jgi:hypothetical protein
LLFRYRVAWLHQDFDDFDLLEVSDVGDGYGHRCARGAALLGLRFGRFCLGRRLELLLRRGFAVAFFFKDQDRRALRYLVANLDLELLHHARAWRGDLHRGLVGLERDQRLLFRHGVARLHQYFDDFDFLEVADVRDENLIHTVVGSAFSGSMPYFLIASAAVFALPSP